jgi:serine/threonine protein kinase
MKLKYFDDRWTIVAPAVQAGLDEESVMADFEVLKRMLGKGAYGVVRKVRHRNSMRVFALKELSKADYRKEVPNYRETVNLELELSYRVRHEHVARLFSHFEDDKSVCMVMEMVEGRCLYNMIAERPLTEEETACIITQLLMVVAHIHDLHILHRDIKP